MNHQTKTIIDDAKLKINDECVFTSDQIIALTDLIDSFSDALEKETSLIPTHLNT